MTRNLNSPKALIALTARAMVIVTMLAAPVLAVPTLTASESNIIEAPAPPNTGLGFVLLHMLKRA